MAEKRKLSVWQLLDKITPNQYNAFLNIPFIDVNKEYELDELGQDLITQWRNIDPTFTGDQVRNWIDRGFSYNETNFFRNAATKPITDPDYARYLRDVKFGDTAGLLGANYPTDDTILKLEFQTGLVNNPFVHATTTTTPTSAKTHAELLYDGLATLYDEGLGLQKEEDKKVTDTKEKEEAKLRQEYDDLKLGIPIFDKGTLAFQSKIPFGYNEEYEDEGATKPDGSLDLDDNGQPYKKRKEGTGIEVVTFEDYKIYRQGQQEGYNNQFGLPPYIGAGGRQIGTYEQGKQVALGSNPTDYLTDKGRLTFIASFLPRFFEKEPFGLALRRHLIEMLEEMAIDFRAKQPSFGERIKNYVEQKPTTIPYAPDLPEDIKDQLEKVRGYIDFVYGAYDPKNTLLNPTKFYGEVEAIIADLEIQLKEVGRKYLQNTRYFSINNNKLLTSITTRKQYGENTNLTTTSTHDKFLEKSNEVDSAETPLKTSEADNLKNGANGRSTLTKNQSLEKTKENLKFDNTKNVGQGGKKGDVQDFKTILKDIDTRLDPRLMEVILKVVDKFVIFGGIQARLDKYFFTLGEPLYHYVNEGEYEDEY